MPFIWGDRGAPANQGTNGMTRLPALLLVVGAATVAAAPSSRVFVSADRTVRLNYPAGVVPSRDFAGRPMMSGGWRLMWDGKPAGRGQGVARFSVDARPTDGVGRVTEMVQVGMSRSRAVVATCGTAGLKGAITRRLPNRMLGGHRWTVWRGGDAGMSQQSDATDWRTVVNGACYAIDRVTYRVRAADPLPRTAPSQASAAARMDAILASVRVG